MNNKNRIIPELRFSEFIGNPTWQKVKLSEVLYEHGLKSEGNEEVYSVSVNKGVVNQIEHLGRSFAAKNTENYKRVIHGDIIYTKSPTGDFPYGIVKQSKIDKNVIISPLYAVFTPITYSLGVLLDAYFESPERTFNYLAPIIQKGAKNTININNNVFLSKEIILPNDEKEQQKIASCLSSLNRVINFETIKLETLKSHKKGLLQNLFPQEGEKVPELRFSEFIGNPTWQKVKLSEVLYEHGLKSEGNEEVYSVSVNKGVVNQIEHLGRSFAAKNTENYKRVIHGDIIYTKSPTGDFPYGIVKQSKIDKNVIISPLYAVFTPITYSLGVLLDAYFESPERTFNYLAPIIQKGAKNTININNNVFLSKEIILPNDEKEQQKIASCLSSLNRVINFETIKLEQLIQHKKGLMQGLFPK